MNQLPETIAIAGHDIELVVNSQVAAWGEFSCDEKKIRLSTRCLEEEAVVRCLDEIFFPAWELFMKTIQE